MVFKKILFVLSVMATSAGASEEEHGVAEAEATWRNKVTADFPMFFLAGASDIENQFACADLALFSEGQLRVLARYSEVFMVDMTFTHPAVGRDHVVRIVTAPQELARLSVAELEGFAAFANESIDQLFPEGALSIERRQILRRALRLFPPPVQGFADGEMEVEEEDKAEAAVATPVSTLLWSFFNPSRGLFASLKSFFQNFLKRGTGLL